uniref:carbonic anhydrase n=1 Tax=viral metagenome TaxID=1070528 RepID=A0A6C0KTK9_9ZZZZ
MNEQTLKTIIFFSVIVILISSIVVIYSSCKRQDYFTPVEAVKTLTDGNKTFQKGDHNLYQNVKPKVAVLCCSEHYIPAEILFNLNKGEVVMVQELGQVPYLNSMASLEYAVGQLGVNSLIVLGHSNCQAVKMAMDAPPHGSPFLDFICKTISDNFKVEDVLDDAIKKNAQSTLHKIIQSSDIINNAINANKLSVMWGVYDEKSGKVDLKQT